MDGREKVRGTANEPEGRHYMTEMEKANRDAKNTGSICRREGAERRKAQVRDPSGSQASESRDSTGKTASNTVTGTV